MPKIQGQNCASSQIISLKHLAYIKLDEIEVNSRAPKGPTHIKNPKRALEIGAFWGLLGPFDSKGPKRPQKAPFSRALFGFFICVGPFGALAPPPPV